MVSGDVTSVGLEVIQSSGLKKKNEAALWEVVAGMAGLVRAGGGRCSDGRGQ